MGMTPNLGKHRKDLHENKTSHYSIAFLLRFYYFHARLQPVYILAFFTVHIVFQYSKK